MTFFGPDLRNGLPIGLGSVAGFGIAPQFSPASLFLGGTVNGAWYDPSDSTTLFTDRAGTTPCGTPGGGSVVPVGLMLDKSQGLTLGSGLITNGDFSNGTTGWTVPVNNTLSVVSGAGKCVSSIADGAYFGQGVSVVADTWYKFTYTAISDGTSKTVSANLGATVGAATYLNDVATGGYAFGTRTFYWRATVTGTVFPWFYGGPAAGVGNYILIDNVSVRAIAGNHAIAANDTTARPELRARVNLLERSEEFDNAYWTKGNTTVTANAAVAPDGTTTADLIYPSVTGTFRSVYRAFSGANSISISVKASGKTWISMMDLTGSSAVAWFDVANGVIGTVTAGYTAAISSQGSGWYRCTVTANSGTFSYAQFNIVDANGSNTGTANGTDGVLLWGADGRPTNIGTAIPAYQRISDANTYDAVGFPRYLVANGTSSAMSTPGNVNLSGTDKATVFAGVRRASTAAAMIAELSADASSNVGAFYLFPFSDVFYGSVGSGVFRQVSTTLAAQESAVITGASNIAAPSVVLRKNGTQVGIDTNSQGTGNFGTYPLFIGARNNASFFLNGNIYSLIVVGSAVSAGQISATEQWVAGKTGITI